MGQELDINTRKNTMYNPRMVIVGDRSAGWMATGILEKTFYKLGNAMGPFWSNQIRNRFWLGFKL